MTDTATFHGQIDDLKARLKAWGWEQKRTDQFVKREGKRLYSVEIGYGCRQIQARVFKSKAKRPWDKKLLGRYESKLWSDAAVYLAAAVDHAREQEEARRG